MKGKFVFLSILIFLSAFTFLSASTKIVATTSMIADLTRNIGGDKVSVVGLMGPGIDPHLYKATTNDMMQMFQADVILYNGLHLEGKMTDVFEKMRKSGKMTRAVAEVLPEGELLADETYENIKDPHVWFDVELWRMVSKEVKEVLSEYDPAHSSLFEKNWKDYDEKLKELSEYIEGKVSEIPEEKRVLITAHDAFNYFGKAYGFEVIGLQGISTVSEAGTADIKNLSDYITDKKIRSIFVETSVSKRNIEALKEAVRHKGFEVEIGGTLFSDSLGDKGTPEESYIGTFKYNIDTIYNGLME